MPTAFKDWRHEDALRLMPKVTRPFSSSEFMVQLIFLLCRLWCPQCLREVYHENYLEVQLLDIWRCPSCRGDCPCALCQLVLYIPPPLSFLSEFLLTKYNPMKKHDGQTIKKKSKRLSKEERQQKKKEEAQKRREEKRRLKALRREQEEGMLSSSKSIGS